MDHDYHQVDLGEKMFLHLAIVLTFVFTAQFQSILLHLLFISQQKVCIKSHGNIKAGFESHGQGAKKFFCYTNSIIRQNPETSFFFPVLVFCFHFFFLFYFSKIRYLQYLTMVLQVKLIFISYQLEIYYNGKITQGSTMIIQQKA